MRGVDGGVVMIGIRIGGMGGCPCRRPPCRGVPCGRPRLAPRLGRDGHGQLDGLDELGYPLLVLGTRRAERSGHGRVLDHTHDLERELDAADGVRIS